MTDFSSGFEISTHNLHPLYIHPGAEKQAQGVNYHTLETALVIIDWRNARLLLMNMKHSTVHFQMALAGLMVVWEKLAHIRQGR